MARRIGAAVIAGASVCFALCAAAVGQGPAATAAGGRASEDKAAPSDVSDDAIAALVAPAEHLTQMLASATLRSQALQIAVLSRGVEATAETYCPALNGAFREMLPAWRANLIAAYRENAPESNLFAATSTSPDAAGAILRPFLEDIGEAMQAKSAQFLTDNAAAVINQTFGGSLDEAVDVEAVKARKGMLKQDLEALLERCAAETATNSEG
ncbi:MAG: hypothetical protein GC152_12880 [Alphaproteobacteria bacterium]|nr:hypothetical protein [Alphaproteobacteria bacterium]